jgi:hypothetical protein
MVSGSVLCLCVCLIYTVFDLFLFDVIDIFLVLCCFTFVLCCVANGIVFVNRSGESGSPVCTGSDGRSATTRISIKDAVLLVDESRPGSRPSRRPPKKQLSCPVL